MLLKWLWQSEEAEDLLNWGQEGVDWVEKEDGTITYPEGVTAETCGYHQNVGWILPNQFNSHVWEGTPGNVWELYDEVTEKAIKSKAFGFQPIYLLFRQNMISAMLYVPSILQWLQPVLLIQMKGLQNLTRH